MKCKQCDGTGEVAGNVAASPGSAPDFLLCHRCGGTGEMHAVLRPTQDGRGVEVLNASHRWTPVLDHAGWFPRGYSRTLARRYSHQHAFTTTDVAPYAKGEV